MATQKYWHVIKTRNSIRVRKSDTSICKMVKNSIASFTNRNAAVTQANNTTLPLDNVPKLAKGLLHFKDEGGYYTYKLTKDGQLTDPTELYAFGSLITHTANDQKHARVIARLLNCEPLFC
jgi:hypothetical protein